MESNPSPPPHTLGILRSHLPVPASYYCPITFDLMVDPVIDPDGNSYERAAIEEWLKRNQTSPVTLNPLKPSDLRPNRALKDSIDLIRDNVREDQKALTQEQQQNIKKDHKKIQKEQTTKKDDGPIKVSACVNDEGYAMVTIEALENRTPVDLAVVIDVSGSMGKRVSLKDGGKEEETNLSVLDVTLHAVRTIITATNDQDRLALITFSTYGKVAFPSTQMNSEGKKAALGAEQYRLERISVLPIATLDKMYAGGATNLWDGLKLGMDAIKDRKGGNEKKAVLLLSDGDATHEPPRGHIPTLEKYIDTNGLPGTIYTFGFGYSMSSELMVQIAEIGLGSFSFIPDATLVGTVFIHSISALLSSVANEMTLSIQRDDDGEPGKVIGGHNVDTLSWGHQLRFGGITNGQSIHIVLKGDQPFHPDITATLSYTTIDGVNHRVRSDDCPVYTDGPVFRRQIARLQLTEVIGDIIKTFSGRKNVPTQPQLDNARRRLDGVITSIKASGVQDDKVVSDLLEDAEGQIREAIESTDYFNKWGNCYLPSIYHAHRGEQCNNFKDPGVQHYCGKLFGTLRDEIDDIFLNLPAIKPSMAPRSTNTFSNFSYGAPGASSSSSASSKPRFSNKRFHSSSNPCFAPDSAILLANGDRMKLADLTKGSLVWTPSGPTAVACVTRSPVSGGQASICSVGDLRVTPWHPVQVNGQWHFPAHIAPTTLHSISHVYNVVLELVNEHGSPTTHVFDVDGVRAIGLGHGLTGRVVGTRCKMYTGSCCADPDELEHPYFGTRKVVKDLKKLSGWHEGQVTLLPESLHRDEHTTLVNGISAPEEAEEAYDHHMIEEAVPLSMNV